MIGRDPGLDQQPADIAHAKLDELRSAFKLGADGTPKSATPKRIAENLDVFSFSLTADEMVRLTALKKPDGRVVNLAWAPEWDR